MPLVEEDKTELYRENQDDVVSGRLGKIEKETSRGSDEV